MKNIVAQKRQFLNNIYDRDSVANIAFYQIFKKESGYACEFGIDYNNRNIRLHTNYQKPDKDLKRFRKKIKLLHYHLEQFVSKLNEQQNRDYSRQIFLNDNTEIGYNSRVCYCLQEDGYCKLTIGDCWCTVNFIVNKPFKGDHKQKNEETLKALNSILTFINDFSSKLDGLTNK